MGERDLKVSFIAPAERALAPLPFHGVGADAKHRSEAHLVELALRSHSLDMKGQSLTISHALHTEVEPGVVVASRCIRQGIPRHIAREGVGLSTLRRVTLPEVSGIELTRNHDAT